MRRANRVEYVHGALTAWYVNGPMGLQQGWTVQERPAGEGDLTLALHSQGLSAQVEANGRSLKLSDDHGATRLHYGGLLAVDATGREMPVRFIVEGEQVRVAVNDAGATYPLIIDPWIQQTVLGDTYGYPAGVGAELRGSSVAMSADGGTLVVGAPRAMYFGSSSGVAYIYKRPAGGWSASDNIPSATLISGNNYFDYGSQFGQSVAISADGGTIVVGAPYEYPGGAVYTYDSDGSVINSWPSSDYSALLGYSVAVSADGGVVAAGAPGAGGNSGAVVVISGGGEVWVNSSGGTSFGLGASVAINASGDKIVAGAPWSNEVYVFVNSGTSWDEDDRLTGFGFRLGASVAMNATGDKIVAGAPGTGAAYVFVNSGASWDEDFNISAGYGLGTSVAMNTSGGKIVAGAPGLNAAYVFVNSGTSWGQDAYLTSLGGSGELGGAVTIADDDTIATGARFYGNGAVVVFGTDSPLPVTVESITRYYSSPTSSDYVYWLVTFDRPVSGLTASNFALVEGGSVSETSITDLSSDSGNFSDTIWWVGAYTGTGNGTLRLDMDNDTDVIPRVDNVPFTTGEVYDIDKGTPTATVQSITTVGSTTTNAASVTWTVTFSEAVTGVAASNFELVGAGASGASIIGVSGSGATRTVTANTGANGALGLNMANIAGIDPPITNTLPVVGGAYTIDKTTPTATVVSIATVGSATTSAASVSWTVTFSQAVTGVATGNFALAATGVSGASITNVTGSGTTWTVIASTGSGSGTLGLNMTEFRRHRPGDQ